MLPLKICWWSAPTNCPSPRGDPSEEAEDPAPAQTTSLTQRMKKKCSFPEDGQCGGGSKGGWGPCSKGLEGDKGFNVHLRRQGHPEGELALDKRICSFDDAPSYLRFNPFITGGYRSSITPKQCMQSVFWLTNETMNIWTHFIGWIFFLSLAIYDACGLLDLPTTHPWDQLVITLMLVSFQACMLLSSLYHIFCCHSERFYRRWLFADLFGVSLALLAVYISGIYYAFSCVPFWLNFYLVTVGAIFTSAMAMQIFPMLSQKELVTEEYFHLRLLVFGGWAAYGVIPTGHWAILHGGMDSPVVALLLPRIVGMYLISAVAFLFFILRIPERIFPGLVNYFGSSHQIWHILIVAALYHWHNTGMLYLEFRATNPCDEEYRFLFPEIVE